MEDAVAMQKRVERKPVIVVVTVHVRRATFNAYLVVNMAVCAVVFLGFSLPRETISGFLGRMSANCKPGWGRRFARIGECLANIVYFWEENHCALVYDQEREARRALYGEGRYD